MLIKIESFGHYLFTFVSVFDDSHQRVFTARPFGDFSVDDAAALDGFLWCAKSGRGDKSGGGEICQIDLNTGDVLARESHSIVMAKIAFAPHAGVILIYGLGGVAGFRLAPFEPLWEINGAFAQLVERRWFGNRTTYQQIDDRPMSADASKKRSSDNLLCAGVPFEASDRSIRMALLPRLSSRSEPEKAELQLKINPISGAHEIERPKRNSGHQVATDPPDIPSVLRPSKDQSITLPDLTYRDIEAHIKGLTRVKSWKQTAVAESLLELTTKFNTGIEGVSRPDGCELIFAVGNKMMDEWEFFEKLNSKNVDVLSEVHGLLNAWLDALETSGRVFPSTDENDDRAAGPMTAALAYLLGSGASCSDILRRFTLLRIGQQEAYSRDVLLTEYIDRQPPGSKEAIALKIFLIFLRERDGLISISEDEASYGWKELGILHNAQKNMLPADFVDLLLEEISRFTQEISFFSDSQKVEAGPIAGLKKLLKKDRPWDRDVEALIRATEVAH